MKPLKLKKVLSDTIEITAEGGTQLLSQIFDGVVGQFLPGIVSIKMSWLQKRTEKRLVILIEELSKRQERIENLLVSVTTDRLETIKEFYLFNLFDYASNEQEEDKIEFLLNGFESAIEKKSDQDEYLTYMDVMSELRVADIPTLLRLSQGQLNTFMRQIDSLEMYKLNKLNQIGLISFDLTWDGNKNFYLTEFGSDFIEFFKERSK